VTEVVTQRDGSTHENYEKREILLFAKASEAEIWIRVRRRDLTSFAGLDFENEPGLTELDAAKDRQNSKLSVSKMHNVVSRITRIMHCRIDR